MNNEDSFIPEDLAFYLELSKQLEFQIQAPEISPNLLVPLEKPAILELRFEDLLEVNDD